MIRREKNGIAWLEFELFQKFKEIRAAVFLRKGGLDFKSAGSLQRALACLDLEEGKIAPGVHGDQVVILEDPPLEPAYDGIISQQKEVGLVVTHADCQAGIFYDPVTATLANVHSGWRGSVQNIFGKTVSQMKERFGVRPVDLLVGISPSLGPDEAEFVNYRSELPESFLPFQHKTNYFDFWAISRMQLLEAGIREENIQIASMPTRENPEDFFSYRRGEVGRNATIVAINP